MTTSISPAVFAASLKIGEYNNGLKKFRKFLNDRAIKSIERLPVLLASCGGGWADVMDQFASSRPKPLPKEVTLASEWYLKVKKDVDELENVLKEDEKNSILIGDKLTQKISKKITRNNLITKFTKKHSGVRLNNDNTPCDDTIKLHYEKLTAGTWPRIQHIKNKSVNENGNKILNTSDTTYSFKKSDDNTMCIEADDESEKKKTSSINPSSLKNKCHMQMVSICAYEQAEPCDFFEHFDKLDEVVSAYPTRWFEIANAEQKVQDKFGEIYRTQEIKSVKDAIKQVYDSHAADKIFKKYVDDVKESDLKYVRPLKRQGPLKRPFVPTPLGRVPFVGKDNSSFPPPNKQQKISAPFGGAKPYADVFAAMREMGLPNKCATKDVSFCLTRHNKGACPNCVTKKCKFSHFCPICNQDHSMRSAHPEEARKIFDQR